MDEGLLFGGLVRLLGGLGGVECRCMGCVRDI